MCWSLEFVLAWDQPWPSQTTVLEQKNDAPSIKTETSPLQIANFLSEKVASLSGITTIFSGIESSSHTQNDSSSPHTIDSWVNLRPKNYAAIGTSDRTRGMLTVDVQPMARVAFVYRFCYEFITRTVWSERVMERWYFRLYVSHVALSAKTVRVY